jgi:hypothetical protein
MDISAVNLYDFSKAFPSDRPGNGSLSSLNLQESSMKVIIAAFYERQFNSDLKAALLRAPHQTTPVTRLKPMLAFKSKRHPFTFPKSSTHSAIICESPAHLKNGRIDGDLRRDFLLLSLQSVSWFTIHPNSPPDHAYPQWRRLEPQTACM